jgi:hypothetical protein
MRELKIAFTLALVLCPALASAQTAPADPARKIQLVPAPTPSGKIDLSTSPPPALVGRSYHMHDGFYLRASVGLGSLGATFDDDHRSGKDLSGSGLSLGMDLMIGGTPSPGFTVGGALLAQGAFSANFDRDSDDEEDRSLSLLVVGPFVDGFPDANRGWHLGGMLGLASANIEDTSADGLSQTLGVGGAFWLGHDFWVADEWSMGPMFRLTGTLTQGDDDAKASSLSAMFLFTALHH